MSGIWGIFNRDGRPVERHRVETMRQAMAEWGPDSSDMLLDGPVGLGQMLFFSIPEAKFERMPVKCLLPHFVMDGKRYIVFTAAGRVDNRDELIRESGVRSQESGVSDGEILLQTYLRWGEDSPVHIYGDWAFAAWDSQEQKLFLARDHFGNTSLYYYADSHVFVFASSRKALLALDFIPVEMDELYLTQVLISSHGYHGERTIHTPIKRLPPAHCLTITKNVLTVNQYWHVEETPVLRLPKREDYAAALREVLDEAVCCRLRSDSDIAVSLSGGLDSGSVAAIAAGCLRRYNKRLYAFTSAPITNTDKYVGKNIGDEFSFAQAVAEYAGNIDLYRITAETITPIQAIRRMLAINSEPAHGAGNFFWIQAIRQAALVHKCRILLTGQVGNAGISWAGTIISQPFFLQLRHFKWQHRLKEAVKQCTPDLILKAYRKLRTSSDQWTRSSAIHPDLVHRLNFHERLLNDSDLYPHTPLEHRLRILMPGRSLAGCRNAENGAYWGLEVRDPTADARVLAFTFSVPDYIFIDPKTGMDRWLIREAMKGHLPDRVRLNRRFGTQAGDLVPRLRASADEVEAALDELASGPAAAYVNVPYMQDVWKMIQTDDTPEAFHKSVTILTRGIMAGLWVNGFYNASRFSY